MKTCLIVDDSRVVRKLARLMIEQLGYECLEAEDGTQGFDACLKAMPDVILLDWNMPGMTGIEFTQYLRKKPGGTAPKIIFCSMYNEAKYIAEALDAGADEFIMKPFDNDIIVCKFQQVGAV